MSRQLVVAVDFDGVLHEYRTKWTVPEEIHDGPTPGAVEWVKYMQGEGIRVVIFSSRAQSQLGRLAIKEWLKKYDFPELEISGEKPHAQLYVDDRAYHFDGERWPSATTVRCFRPWNRDRYYRTPISAMRNQAMILEIEDLLLELEDEETELDAESWTHLIEELKKLIGADPRALMKDQMPQAVVEERTCRPSPTKT